MRSTVQLNLPPSPVTSVDTRVSPSVTADDREADWLGLVTRAMGKSALSHKAMAADLDIDRAQLSRQLAGTENHHLSFRRMWRLSPEFWNELLPLIREFHGLAPQGLTQQDAEDLAVGRLMREAVLRIAR